MVTTVSKVDGVKQEKKLLLKNQLHKGQYNKLLIMILALRKIFGIAKNIGMKAQRDCYLIPQEIWE